MCDHTNIPVRPGGASGRWPAGRERGVALVTTLILLALLGAASMAIALLVSSDTMINGFYRNYRGSFYAADSGVNVVVQAIQSQILSTAVDNGANGAPPLSVGGVTMPANANTWTPAGSTAAGFLSAAYSPYQSKYYTIGDSGSWMSKFELVANPDGNPVIGSVQFEVATASGDANSCWPPSQSTCFNGKTNVTNDYNYTWTYAYPYEVTIKGQSSGSEAEEVTEKGIVTYSSTSGNAAGDTPPSFSKWAAFITNYGACTGALVPGYMTGPFFTDGQWGFGNFSNPGYTFTGSVGQVSSNVSWYKSGCDNASSSNPPNGMKLPTFQQGFQPGAQSIQAPSNSYNQAQAVLDGKGAPPCTTPGSCPSDPPPSQAQMNQELKLINGTPYPSSGTPSSGVYIPYYTTTSGTGPGGQACSSGSPCYFYGGNSSGTQTAAGGFYVQGNASVGLSASTGCGGVSACGSSDLTQTYTITQGTTTTTIVVDNTTGVTVVNGQAMQGVPQQLDPTSGQAVTQTDPSGNPVNPTLLYVTGNITGLQGTVQNLNGIDITGNGDVDITGNVTYAQEPVSVPADALNSSANSGVIGIYTATGNIVLSSPYSNHNLEVDGSLAAIGGSCASNSCGFKVSGSINTFNNVGGQIQTNIFSANMSAENTYYDVRFGNNFGPPWFPTAVPQAGAPAHLPSQGTTIQRTSWQELRP
jgi:hypothetical protein